LSLNHFVASGMKTCKESFRFKALFVEDVVAGSPVGRTGGVIHYEFGKTIQNQKFERTGAPDVACEKR
jgi:hypothetical protein